MKSRKPIFQWILFLLMLLTIVEILILVFTFIGQGLIQELNHNEEDVLHGRVYARKNYLESLILNDWMDIDDTVDEITQMLEAYLTEKDLEPRQIEDDLLNSEAMLTQATPALLAMMRDNRVTGAYMVLCTGAVSSPEDMGAKPGVYLRDADPTSLSFEQNEDILLKVSPPEVLKSMRIPTDSDWDMYFRFQDRDAALAKIFTIPLKKAWDSGGTYSWKDLGYWGIPQSQEEILTYTVPLILSDGTVMGLVGIDITFQYLDSLLPYQELGFEEHGTYLLTRHDQASGIFFDTFSNGMHRPLIESNHGSFLIQNRYHICSQELRLYDTNTPFSDQRWIVAGVVPEAYMHQVANDLILAVIIAVSTTLLIGVLMSFLLSWLLQKPISQIARELASANPKQALALSPTGIREIDAISEAAVQLSQDVMENARMFSEIIEMSSIRMSAFRVESTTGKLFLSDNFFSIFGEKDIAQENMDMSAFLAHMKTYTPFVTQRDNKRGLFTLRMTIDGQSRYIQLRYREVHGYGYGLVEDVTQEVIERQLLQHERDHDSLTGLLNRRAFRSRIQAILEQPLEALKFGAMLMIDLDNLKFINDSYGHESGDQYIIRAATDLEQATGSRGICARISGDEFNIFLYGFDSCEELDRHVKSIQDAVNAGTVRLPNEKELAVHATGGVAHFPEHSRSMEKLLKHADYAMYVAKRSKKRTFQLFTPEMFHNPDIRLRNSETLTRMLQYKQVYYAFQPIVDARSGDIFAYEALMRPEVESHFTVADVLETARRDGKLDQVEELTLFEAMETYVGFLASGDIREGTYLFVNSIANLVLAQEKGERFTDTYAPYLRHLVLELTEDERINLEHWQVKQSFHRSFGGMIALDDYGSGYNSEVTLLAISPDFIKVDMSIIRDIHLDNDKQAIVSNIVRYAHERGKFIIAEGVETVEEVQKLMQMQVDYMQGYFFGRPQRLPQDISAQAKALLGK